MSLPDYMHDALLKFTLIHLGIIVVCCHLVLNSSDTSQETEEFKVRAAARFTSIARALLDSRVKLSDSCGCR